jgi:hypothetical protein
MQRTCISRRGSQFLADGRGFSGAQMYHCLNRGARKVCEATLDSMRGTPWLRFVLMAIALALTAVPIWLLMRSEAPPAHGNSAPPKEAERQVTLEIVSAPPADSIRVSYLGQELASENQRGSYSGTLRLPSSSPADLVLVATWQGTTQRAALHVQVSNEDGPIADASYWGTNRVDDVFTIPESTP